jgi:nitrite reductase/ring-hydroxylating ferredoxin subunit
MPTHVAQLCEVPPGHAKVVRVDYTDVLLVKLGGEIHSFADGCINCSASLCGARVHGEQMACPLCGWTYDVLSGAVTANARLRLDKYVVRINGSSIEVVDQLA